MIKRKGFNRIVKSGYKVNREKQKKLYGDKESITAKDIISKVSVGLNIPEFMADAVVTATFDCIIQALAEDKMVNIDGWGIYYNKVIPMKLTKPCMKSPERYIVPTRLFPVFLSTHTLRTACSKWHEIHNSEKEKELRAALEKEKADTYVESVEKWIEMMDYWNSFVFEKIEAREKRRKEKCSLK